MVKDKIFLVRENHLRIVKENDDKHLSAYLNETGDKIVIIAENDCHNTQAEVEINVEEATAFCEFVKTLIQKVEEKCMPGRASHEI